MAKSKKKRQEDFQKVKLKVGKKLPKGQNVTNTSFKTRAIQVIQQMKADVTQPSTHRKLNITDLLAKCQHYSISVRHEGVTGLRELMTAFPDMQSSHLSTVIEKAMPLIVDKDHNVRQATFKLFKLMFPGTPSNKIEPFFAFLSAHLCCAMTHIQDDVQHDSLKLFDILLEIYPELIAVNSDQLLQNFIEQISRHQILKGRSSKFSLGVRPDSKFAEQKWRSGILSRVHKLLSALMTHKVKDTASISKITEDHVYHIGSRVPTQFSTCFQHAWTNPGYKMSSKAIQAVGSPPKGDNFGDFAASLIPILIQCWVECQVPQAVNKPQDNLVPASSLTVMYHVIKVLHLVWACLRQEALLTNDSSKIGELCRKHEKDFLHHIMSHFPYSVQPNSGYRGKKNKKESTSVSTDAVNLAICEVMTSVATEMTDRKRTESLENSIGEYLCMSLDNRGLNSDLIKTVVDTLHSFLKVCKNPDLIYTVLEKAVARFKQAHPLSTEKRLFLELFTDVFLSSDLELLQCKNFGPLVDEFFQSLPELLLQVSKQSPQVAALTIHVMQKAACQNCCPLLEELENSFIRSLDLGDGVFCWLGEKLQRGLLDLLYRVPRLSSSLLKKLVAVCHHGGVSSSTASYLLDIVHLRFENLVAEDCRSEHNVAMTTTYLSFLLSILSFEPNHHQDMEEEYQDGYQFTSAPKFSWTRLNVDLWNKHMVITKKVLHCLRQLPDLMTLTPVIWEFWTDLLSSRTNSHVTIMASVLRCFTQVGPDKASQSVINFITSLGLSLAMDMVTMVNTEDHVTSVSNQLWEWLIQSLLSSPSIITRFFGKVESEITDCTEEVCTALLMSTARVLQDQTSTSLPSVVGGHLEGIRQKVQSCFTEVMKTQVWTDFEYSCSVVLSKGS